MEPEISTDSKVFEDTFLQGIRVVPFEIGRSLYRRLWKNHYSYRLPPRREIIRAYYSPASATLKDGSFYPNVVFLRRDFAILRDSHLKWIFANDPESLSQWEIMAKDVSSVIQFPDRLPENIRRQILKAGMTGNEETSFVLELQDGREYTYRWSYVSDNTPGDLDFLSLPDGASLDEVKSVRIPAPPMPSEIPPVLFPKHDELKMCYY